MLFGVDSVTVMILHKLWVINAFIQNDDPIFQSMWRYLGCSDASG